MDGEGCYYKNKKTKYGIWKAGKIMQKMPYNKNSIHQT